MFPQPDGELTKILRDVHDGVPGATDRLFALVYDQLRALARARLRSRFDTGEPTTLVHDVYLKLFNTQDVSWENHRHFFFAAARAMRDIVVERARTKNSQKKGGGKIRHELTDSIAARDEAAEAEDLEALDQALERFEAKYPEAARVVMLKFFAGLNREQIAEVLAISSTDVWRLWNFAKASLLADLGDRKIDLDR